MRWLLDRIEFALLDIALLVCAICLLVWGIGNHYYKTHEKAMPSEKKEFIIDGGYLNLMSIDSFDTLDCPTRK